LTAFSGDVFPGLANDGDPPSALSHAISVWTILFGTT